MLIANVWCESHLGVAGENLWPQAVKYGFPRESKLRTKCRSQHYPWHIPKIMEGMKVSDAKGMKACTSQKHFKNSYFSLTVVFGGEQEKVRLNRQMGPHGRFYVLINLNVFCG